MTINISSRNYIFFFRRPLEPLITCVCTCIHTCTHICSFAAVLTSFQTLWWFTNHLLIISLLSLREPKKERSTTSLTQLGQILVSLLPFMLKVCVLYSDLCLMLSANRRQNPRGGTRNALKQLHLYPPSTITCNTINCLKGTQRERVAAIHLSKLVRFCSLKTQEFLLPWDNGMHHLKG